MAEKARAKHAFGKSSDIQTALNSGKIDTYDILFLDGDTEPKIGWIDRNGEARIVDNTTDLSGIEANITELEKELTTKVNAEEVDAKINEKFNSIEHPYDGAEYVVSHKPEGTIIDYRDKEIRVMCPADTQWALQQSGENADPNMYYMGIKAYAPSDDVVSFKEDTKKIIEDDTMYYFEDNEFAGVDADGRKYSIIWLPLASYDGTNWTYYGTGSADGKYVGWYYSVEWYNVEGVVVASDCIRINLSNEKCHSAIEPYYIEEVKAYADLQIETKIAEVSGAIEVVEF